MEDGMFGPVTDQQRDALGRVRMSGRHLLSLLDNVMDMARLTAGLVSVHSEPVRVFDVARDAVDILIPASYAKRQRLELGECADVTVRGDSSRLRQVLVNLIGNSVKFTAPDGSVIVSTSELAIDGRMWGEIRVTDTGPGIAESDRAAIFEPYFRSAGTGGIPGVGLGLAISAALVVQMGGRLEVESEVGVGSSFTIRLPRLAELSIS
jgi:signal transduction histidine kinase